MVKEKEGKKGKKTETKDTKPKASPKLAPKASPKLSPKASPKLAPKDPKTKTKKRKAEETEGAKPKKEKKTTDQEGTEKKDSSLGVCNVSDIKEISDASQKALLSKNITTFPGGTILEPRVTVLDGTIQAKRTQYCKPLSILVYVYTTVQNYTL